MLRTLRGYVELEITGASPERCLNRLAEKDIPFWNIQQVDAFHLTCCLYTAHLEAARKEISAALCTEKVLRIRGLPHGVRGLRNRPVLIVGFLLALVLAYVSQCFVWFVRVEGAVEVPPEQILQAIDTEGVAFGAWGPKLDSQYLKNRMGLFTFDPQYVNLSSEYWVSPDYRNWGGGVHTAQNQRLVYWPMLKSGDYDLLIPQLEFYRNIYQNAEERSRLYWGHEGACLTEQVENYGLPCYPEYGTKRPEGFDPGMERNAWLEYEWDTCLEFCQMALEAHRYNGTDIRPYIPMIRSCLQFFDEHYQYLANRRGAKTLDNGGHLVLYPGSGGETYKGAYNSTSTIAALRTVTMSLMAYAMERGDSALLEQHASLLSRLPDITIRDGMIAPALHYERVQNTESTQLYPVFPWRMYGVGRPDIDIARNTYQNDSLAIKFRSHIGWKQDAIWAACLGMTDEAEQLITQKLADGPHRFPAFWGPGFDWTPDHNWGGSGMIALQEMLLQEVGDKLYLFPAWPKSWNVRFRLRASRKTTVEAELNGGKVVRVKVLPVERLRDVVMPK